MKRLLVVFLVFGIIFPLFSFGAGTYKVVKTKEDPETGKEEIEYEFEVEYDGLIPCGKCLNVKSGNPEYQEVELQRCGANKKFIPCQICHIFILISDLIKFFYSELLYPLLGVLITILGFLLLLSEIHPVAFAREETVISAIERIKEGVKLTAFAFFFLLSLWFLLNLFFSVMGVAEWTGLQNWFKISCTIKELPLGPLTEEAGLPPTVLGCPTDGGEITSPCAWGIKGSHAGRMHTGIDIAGSRNSNIYAVENGKVIFAGYWDRYGNTVAIQHHNGLITLYAHLNQISVRKGDEVKMGQKIGEMGNSGGDYGVHLHFEVRQDNQYFLNPERFIGHCGYTRRSNIPQRYDESRTCEGYSVRGHEIPQ